ncbi:MAG: universal stress protein [Pseudomonadota bacterium]
MSTSVLVSVDLSHPEASKPVLTRAAQLAELDKASLSVMTVVPDFGSGFVGTFFEPGTLDKALAAAQSELHALVDATLPGHGAIQHIIACGSVYDEILATAEKIGADLIVLGASKPDLATRLIGPNAIRVASHTEASIYIVR